MATNLGGTTSQQISGNSMAFQPGSRNDSIEGQGGRLSVGGDSFTVTQSRMHLHLANDNESSDDTNGVDLAYGRNDYHTVGDQAGQGSIRLASDPHDTGGADQPTLVPPQFQSHATNLTNQPPGIDPTSVRIENAEHGKNRGFWKGTLSGAAVGAAMGAGAGVYPGIIAGGILGMGVFSFPAATVGGVAGGAAGGLIGGLFGGLIGGVAEKIFGTKRAKRQARHFQNAMASLRDKGLRLNADSENRLNSVTKDQYRELLHVKGRGFGANKVSRPEDRQRIRESVLLHLITTTDDDPVQSALAYKQELIDAAKNNTLHMMADPDDSGRLEQARLAAQVQADLLSGENIHVENPTAEMGVSNTHLETPATPVNAGNIRPETQAAPLSASNTHLETPATPVNAGDLDEETPPASLSASNIHPQTATAPPNPTDTRFHSPAVAAPDTNQVRARHPSPLPPSFVLRAPDPPSIEKQIDNLFPGMSVTDFKNVFCNHINQSIRRANLGVNVSGLAPDDIEVSVDDLTGALKVTAGGVAGIGKIDILFRKDHIQLESLRVNSGRQGRGIMKGLFPALLELHDRSNGKLTHMKMTASWETGGYVWARYGFRASGNGKTFPIVRKNTIDQVTNRIESYMKRHDDTLSKEQKKMLTKLLIDLHGSPDTKIFRRVAALTFEVDPNEKDFAPGLKAQDLRVKPGSWTLGKACLCGTSWLGYFDFEEDREYLEAYLA